MNTDVTDEIRDEMPPCDLDIEQAVLGCMLLSQTCFDDVGQHVQTNDFYSHQNQMLFTAMMTMHEAGGRVDVALLRDQLKTAGDWNGEGKVTGIDAAYLADVMQAVPVYQNAEYYAKIVREKSVLRSLRRAGEDIIHESFDPQADPSEALTKCQKLIAAAQDRTAEPAAAASILAIKETEYLQMLERGEEELFSLGIPCLDRAIGGGCEAGELVVVGGLPSHGKTVVALQAARATIEAHRNVVFVSLEMTGAQISRRMIASRTKRESREWSENTGELRDDSAIYWQAAGKMFMIEHTRDIQAIERKIGAIAKENEPGLIVVDHAQLVQGRGSNRYEQMTNVSAACKGLAIKHDCPLILVSQLSREAARSGVAEAHHLRETGALEQDADVVILVRWPWKVDPEHEEPHRYELKVAKNRNRPIINWNVECRFNPARQRIEEVQSEHQGQVDPWERDEQGGLF